MGAGGRQGAVETGHARGKVSEKALQWSLFLRYFNQALECRAVGWEGRRSGVRGCVPGPSLDAMKSAEAGVGHPRESVHVRSAKGTPDHLLHLWALVCQLPTAPRWTAPRLLGKERGTGGGG